MFFSSRRRHKRYWRVCSSDVCYSDLGGGDLLMEGAGAVPPLWGIVVVMAILSLALLGLSAVARRYQWRTECVRKTLHVGMGRSEERRVGKERRSRGWPNH